MARCIGKKEIERMGKLYAEQLLRNPAARPEDLPGLVEHSGWVGKGENIKAGIVYDIRTMARKLLIDAGYKHQNVIRVIGF